MRPQLLPTLEGLKEKTFGGSLIKGNARVARPISVKRPMHLVMRSTLAKGERSLLRRSQTIEKLVHRLGRTKGVKVYRYANSGNHLHLVILPKSRNAYFAFIRAVSGLIPRLILGVQRGKPLKLKFWDTLPYTKIIEWGRQFKRAHWYVLQNRLEAEGFIAFTPRKGVKARSRAKPRAPAKPPAPAKPRAPAT
jgi:hypothetical protein